MLMSPNKDETAVHGCHCLGDMAVRMRKVLAIPRSSQGTQPLGTRLNGVVLCDHCFQMVYFGILRYIINIINIPVNHP